jgi:hypothetical protein
VIALALLTSLITQDTTGLPPRVRAMIERFPPPHAGIPSITIGFSRDTVWIGEQVELLTATWFPRSLLQRLRHMPTIRPPSLSGLWSAKNQQTPVQAQSRFVGNQTYDMYVTWQTIFPLGPGKIDAPAAMLSYGLPTSTAYFAPEERKTYASAPAVLVVRAIPPALNAQLGSGPVAQGLHLAWRGPASGFRVGSPAIVELVATGEGNLTLWPTPQISWPPGIRVYPEATVERVVASRGLIAGEKHFRYTVVSDSAAVLMLPAVTYSYFDPSVVAVRAAVASPFPLVILRRPLAASGRTAPIVTNESGTPLSARLMRNAWPALLLVALLPPVIVAWRRKRRAVGVPVPSYSDAEAELRAALGTPVQAGPDHVIAALRLRGISREDAEHVHRWLSATARRRYGPSTSDMPAPPAAITMVLARLRHGMTAALLLMVLVPMRSTAQRIQADSTPSDGAARYDGGDFAGAERAFAAIVDRVPDAAGAWRNLGAARWMAGNDVAAAAAWLAALRLTPRDPLLRASWQAATTIPTDVRDLAPRVPVSRDELLLASLVLWLTAWLAIAMQWRRAAWVTGAMWAALLVLTLVRWSTERRGDGLLAANSTLRISPHPAMMPVPQGELPVWTRVHVERANQGWLLVSAIPASRGTLGSLRVEGWVPASAVALIGPGS